MALSRGILSMLLRHRVGIRQYADGKFYEDLDLLTGVQKRELLQHISGECDPFHIMPLKRGATAPGTREKPILVPSSLENRLVGCRCCPEQYHFEYMVVHKNIPIRCACGYWYALATVPPV